MGRKKVNKRTSEATAAVPEVRAGAARYYIFATLFFTGAAVMVIELLGTRVIGPYYGASLYVWSSLISVTLVALSLGYWWGGRHADRLLGGLEEGAGKAEGDLLLGRAGNRLYLLILLAGLAILASDLLATPVLELTSPLGLRMGALTSAVILFTLPLALLGTVTPFAVRLITNRLGVVGSSAGNLFAVSTIGSVIGSVMTGFVLIPQLGTKKILYLQAAILVVLWAVWSLAGRNYISAVIALPVIGFCLAGVAGASELPEAEGYRVIERTESFYGRLQVVDKDYKRWLTVDGAPQTGIDKRTGYSLLPYTYYLELANYIRPEAKKALVIGLGGGSITERFRSYGLEVDTVEINPEMLAVAEEYFGFKTPGPRGGSVYIEDARRFLINKDKTYDIIVLDAFTVDMIPFHLFTMEMFREIKASLSEHGLLGINFLGYPGGEEGRITASVHRTLSGVFENVKAYGKNPETESGFENILFFASEGSLRLHKSIEEQEIKEIREILADMLGHELRYEKEEGTVLTDNYNPIEFWGLAGSEAWRRNIQSYLPKEVLIH